jgi:hypothetical protein
MLDLMTDVSQDMAGTLSMLCYFYIAFLCLSVCYIAFSFSSVGAFLGTAAEEQRVNLLVDSLLRLARDNKIDFWADEARRRIV